MKTTPRQIIRTYLLLLVLNTLAASLIWGVNTLFLLDAGLSITQAFLANAFFTAGQVIFEIPTGVVADTMGRRFSYMLGTVTLAVTTLLYYLLWLSNGSFIGWAAVSALLGLGFTFFSGATEAWLVDALDASGYTGTLEAVFARGQVFSGITMLAGSLGGGLLAQALNLGAPYILRSVLLVVSFAAAWMLMRDIGFTPERSKTPIKEMKRVFGASLEHGLKVPAIRWIMLSGPFGYGVSFYVFYAMQPYLLELYGNSEAYWVAGLAAAITAGAQVAGGLAVPRLVKRFKRRTSYLLMAQLVAISSLVVVGLFDSLVAAIMLLVVWAAAFAAISPVRQAYLNALIPSRQRATVLSTDNLLGSAGGVVIQPAMGKAADVWSLGASFMLSGVAQALAVPFLLLARRQHSPAEKPSPTVDAKAQAA